MTMPIKVVCKQCGRSANSEEFILDPVFKMMVCPYCVKDRKAMQQKPKEAPKKEEKPKAPGWDHDDEYLERAYRNKIKDTLFIERIDAEFAKYKCPKCSYVFKYNIIKKTPSRCPYCSTDIGRVQVK